MTDKRHNPWVVLISLVLGFFMILLDTTIVNIAIPSMIDGLHATLDEILWVLNAYILVFAVLLITAGRLGDLYGPKRLFLIGLAIFTLASAACGLAPTAGWLIAARVAQGVGGALLTPQTLSTLTQIFPAERRGAALGVWGAVAGLATIAGPTLGGFLVTRFGWEWIFFVNVPVGIFAFALAAAVFPDLRSGRRHKLDIPGTLLVTAALFLICFGLIEGQKYDWGTITGFISIPLLLGAGAVLLAVFLVVQYVERNREPLVPFSLFRDRDFGLMNYVAAAIGFAMLGMFLPLVIFLQSVLGLSALQAGLTIAPMSLLSMFVAPVAGRLSDRIGGKYILITGLTCFTAGMAVITAASHPDAGRWDFLPGLLLAGFGIGCTFSPMTTVAMHNVRPQEAGAASGVFNTTRQVGAVIGSAAVGALLQNQLHVKLGGAARAHAAELPPQLRDQFVSRFSGASSSGLEVGAGQSGIKPPAGIPEQLREVITRVATTVFHEGFANAMRLTFLLPLTVLASAAIACLFIKRRKPRAAETVSEAEAAAAAH